MVSITLDLKGSSKCKVFAHNINKKEVDKLFPGKWNKDTMSTWKVVPIGQLEITFFIDDEECRAGKDISGYGQL